MELENLQGQVFEQLEVLELDTESPPGVTKWICKCACGKVKSVRASLLKDGKAKTCGHLRAELLAQRNREHPRAGKIKNMKGLKFGKLEVGEMVGRSNAGKPVWQCKCQCGREVPVVGASLRQGLTKSCGVCEKHASVPKTHGHAGKLAPPHVRRTYICWLHMKSRCNNENDQDYENYGGRGISYDQKWEKFEEFLAEMGEAPAGLELDRKDNNLGYSKMNCHWTNELIQSRNRRFVKQLEFRGESMSLQEWADKLKQPYHRLYIRIHRGMSVEEALTR